MRPTGLTLEEQRVPVPENVANIIAMYLKARPILFVCLTCPLIPGVRYRCLTECNSRFILGQEQTVQGELSLGHTCGKDFSIPHIFKNI